MQIAIKVGQWNNSYKPMSSAQKPNFNVIWFKLNPRSRGCTANNMNTIWYFKVRCKTTLKELHHRSYNALKWDINLEGSSPKSWQYSWCFVVGTTAGSGTRPRFTTRLVPAAPHSCPFLARLQQVLGEQTLLVELQSWKWVVVISLYVITSHIAL